MEPEASPASLTVSNSPSLGSGATLRRYSVVAVFVSSAPCPGNTTVKKDFPLVS